MLIENYYKYVNRKLLQTRLSKIITDTLIENYYTYVDRKLLQLH